MSFTFKRWFDEKYRFHGEEIAFELKHLTAFEERSVRAPVVRAMGAMDDLKTAAELRIGTLAETSAATLEKMNESLSLAFTREVFEKYVRNVRGVRDEDGTERTDGLFLLEIADDAFLWHILLKLLGNGKVSAEEGKVSGSPSTSGLVAAQASSGSGSTVSNTVSVVSPTPSTATVTLERSPSGAQEAIQGT